MGKTGKAEAPADGKAATADNQKSKDKESKGKKKSSKTEDASRDVKEPVEPVKAEGKISQCPDLILQLILSHLEHTHLFRSQRVSTKWRLNAQNCISKADSVRIRHTFPKSLDDDVFRHIVTKKYNATLIQEVSLHSVPHLTDKVCKHIADYLPSVTSIEILHACNVTDKGLRSLGSLPLKSLRMSHVPITEKGIRSFFDRIGPSLISLDISHCAQVDMDDLAAVISGKAPLLERLNLTRCYGLSDAAVTHIGSITSLKELRLCWMKRVSAKGMLSFVSDQTASAALSVLDLTGCAVSDEVMALLPQKFPKLKTLKLGYCGNLKPAGLENVKLLRHLRVLHLEFTLLDDASLRSLEALKHLRCLSLAGTEYLREKAIDKFRGRSAAHVADYFLAKPKANV
jgi:hypothetical protein